MDLFITPLFTIGPFQIVVIVVVALIVFGPVGLGKKLGNLVKGTGQGVKEFKKACLLYTSPSPRDLSTSRMPSSA